MVGGVRGYPEGRGMATETGALSAHSAADTAKMTSAADQHLPPTQLQWEGGGWGVLIGYPL